MSWQAYVDTNLVGTGKVSRAAILGQKGGVWATSSGYNLSTQEQNKILEAHGNLDATQSHGILLAGKKYFTLQADKRSIYLKKGADGALLVKTKQAILVAEYNAPVQAPEATKEVEGLADYLINAGY